ncbi:MAG: YkvA family protein [Sphingomonas sp.]|uniref:YkvA family protein n=1 Tax=Sphingomonas sp. TaxID=28214 RepID=UPI003F7FD91A
MKLSDWARALKRDVVALWIAARDPRVPWYAKATAGAVAAYALSPIDLIPDVIPVLGYLDDLLIVPAGIWLAVRMIGPALMAEFRARASETGRPKSYGAAVVIVLLWLAALALAVRMASRAGWL